MQQNFTLQENYMNNKYFMTNIKLTGVTLAMAQDVIRDLILGSGVSKFSLVRDANNKYDQSAVMVCCLSFFLGWVPMGLNSNLAAEMDGGKVFEAELVRVLDNPNYPTRGVVINIVEIG
jgi:hypothetical protein